MEGLDSGVPLLPFSPLAPSSGPGRVDDLVVWKLGVPEVIVSKVGADFFAFFAFPFHPLKYTVYDWRELRQCISSIPAGFPCNMNASTSGWLGWCRVL